MELPDIGTLKHIPINGRRVSLRSRTVDTFLHILAVCYSDSSNIIQISDKDETNTHIESVTKSDVSLDCTNIIHNDSLCEEQMVMDETRVVLDTQEDGLYNKVVKSSETQMVLDCIDIIPNDSLCEEQMVMDETRMVLDIQEHGLYNKVVESSETQVVSDCIDIIPYDLYSQEQRLIDETRVVLDTQVGGLDYKLVESAETQVVFDTQGGGLDSKLVESAETQVMFDTQEGSLYSKLVESAETQVVFDTQGGGLDSKLVESAETQVVFDTQEGSLYSKLVESTETQVVLDTQEGCLDNKLVESAETHVILDCTDIILNDSLSQLQMFMDLDTQEDVLCNELVESVEYDDNLFGEKNDLSQKVDTNPSSSSDIKNHDNFDKDVEEGEISGEFMDFMTEDDTQSVDKTGGLEREDFIDTELGLENVNNLIPLSTDIVENVGKDMAGSVSKTARNLVDYSEIVVPRKPREYAKQVTSEHMSPLLSSLKNCVTKNQDLVYPLKEIGEQNNKKRVGSCTEDEKAIKKVKKSYDENSTSLGEHPKDTSQKVVDASANEDASNEKKKKRVLTKERKAKKKRKERIKRAENNRKLGVKRLKLQPMIKEKKITYCRHYMVGRCHEGEKCKFSHDTIPLTKSKPCCHFARHACMKGNDCPFDHELSKYPCNNFLTKGFCNRGSDCMFSHEAKPSETPLDALKEATAEQKVETKSCFVPKEQNIVKITPKLSATPPKGISFLSQETSKMPVNQDFKDTTKTPTLIQYSKKKSKTYAVQDSEEITKTPHVIQEITKMGPVTPRGINFLSFGKKPGLDQLNGGFTFKISNGIERSRLSNLVNRGLKSESTLNSVNEVKVKADFLTDKPSSSHKPIAMLPFMSSISQKSLQSTLDFASTLGSGVKINKQI